MSRRFRILDRKIIFNKVIISGHAKPWLVMIHGFTQNHKVFERQVAHFLDLFNILLIDLRGHGGSAQIRGPFGIEEYADDLEAVVNYYRIKKFFCWGTHTGTAVALVYALRHPGRIRGLVLEGTVLPGFEMPCVTELIERAREISIKNGIEAAKRDWFYNADWFAYIRNHPKKCRIAQHWEIISQFSGEPWISTLQPQEVTNVNQKLDALNLPALIYNGGEDMDDFIRVAKHIKHKKDEIQLEIIPYAGGFPCWENPEEVNRLVKDFLYNIVDRAVLAYKAFDEG